MLIIAGALVAFVAVYAVLRSDDVVDVLYLDIDSEGPADLA